MTRIHVRLNLEHEPAELVLLRLDGAARRLSRHRARCMNHERGQQLRHAEVVDRGPEEHGRLLAAPIEVDVEFRRRTPHELDLVAEGCRAVAEQLRRCMAHEPVDRPKDNKHEAALAANIERFKGIWTVVYNKYYVDELYQKTVLNGSVAWARICSWFDGNILDAIVNLAGKITLVFANLDGAIDKYLVD